MSAQRQAQAEASARLYALDADEVAIFARENRRRRVTPGVTGFFSAMERTKFS